MISRPVYLFCILIFFITGCIKDEFDADKFDKNLGIEGYIAVPLGYARLEITDIIEETGDPYIKETDGRISLVYQDTVPGFGADDLISLQDLSLDFPVRNNTGQAIDLNSLSENLLIEDTIWIQLATATAYQRYDIIILESGMLETVLQSGYDLNGMLRLHSEQILLSGQPLDNTRPLSSPQQGISLEDATLVPDSNYLGTNMLMILADITLNRSQGVILTSENFLGINIGMKDLAYNYIGGYFDRYTIAFQGDPAHFNFFGNFKDGSFHFADALFALRLENSFSIPMNLAFESFEMISPGGGSFPVAGEGVPDTLNPFILDYPPVDQAGQSRTSALEINSGNSNLEEALLTNPEQISYRLQSITNPSGYALNALFADSRLDAYLTMTLPFYGYADYLVMDDTLGFDFSDFYNDSPDEIQYIEFRLNYINAFPVNITTQLYFLDDQLVTLDSMMEETQVIGAAKDMDGDGRPEQLQDEVFTVRFDHDKTDRLSRSAYLMIQARMNTDNYDQSPPENISIFSDQYLDINLGAIVAVKASISP